jgi:hypothetical protein
MDSITKACFLSMGIAILVVNFWGKWWRIIFSAGRDTWQFPQLLKE